MKDEESSDDERIEWERNVKKQIGEEGEKRMIVEMKGENGEKKRLRSKIENGREENGREREKVK